MTALASQRFLIARRITQIGTLLLFWLGANWGLGILTGNLSSSRVFRTIPLSDPYAVLQILASGHALAGTVLLGALIVLVFYFLVGGRAFCGWVCPVNLISDAAASVKRKKNIRGQLRVPRYTRNALMVLSLIVSAIAGVAAFEWVSPIAILHRELIYGPGAGLFLVVASLFALDLFVLRDGWCQSLCPLGAFYSAVGHYSPLRIGFDPERCDHCGDCTRVCPEPQVLQFKGMEKLGFVDGGQCLNCGRCIEVCPTSALSFSTRFHRGSTTDE